MLAHRPLKGRREVFVREYLAGCTAMHAAIRAGYSEMAATQTGSRLLKEPAIREALEVGRRKTAELLELAREEVIRQYQRIGFSDIRKLFDENGRIKPLAELDEDTAAAIQNMDVEVRPGDGPDSEPVRIIKIRMADRKTALDSIMKAQGWNMPDQVEVAGRNGGPIQHEHKARVVIVPPKVPSMVETRPLESEGELT
ncbi:terminase small subunit [Cereibacter sphaeroides]|uniref:terminase small subunit n=1 Tax=Cereibacter sphaeroides TaxID=1063 RepID=UPI00313D8C7B